MYSQRRCRVKPFLPYRPVLPKTKNKLAKIQHLKFSNSLNSGVGSLPVCMDFWEWNCCILSEEMSLKSLLPYGPMLTYTKTKIEKIQTFWKTTTKVLEMLWIGTFPPNLALICFMFHAKWVLQTDTRRTTDRWRTTDTRAMTVAQLCSSTKQS